MIRRAAGLALLLCSIAVPMLGYQLWGVQLTKYAATHTNICFNSGVADSARSAFYAGAHDWEEETNVNVSNIGTCGDSTATIRVKVKWTGGWGCQSGDPLAVTKPQNVASNGDASWALIEMNKDCWDQGDLFTGYPNTVPCCSWDLYSVALHEMGHVYGLDHDNTGLTMQTVLMQGVRLDVGADDIAAVNAVYGW